MAPYGYNPYGYNPYALQDDASFAPPPPEDLTFGATPPSAFPDDPWGAGAPQAGMQAGMFDYMPDDMGMGQAGQEWDQYAQLGQYGPPQQQGAFGFPESPWGDGGMQGDMPQLDEQDEESILNNLLSPDPNNKYIAAAMFAEGFVNPETTLRWAANMQQQRQEQRAKIAQEQIRVKGQQKAKKAASDQKAIWNSWQRARDSGVLEAVEQELGKPWTQWTPDDTATADMITSKHIAKKQSEEAETKRMQSWQVNLARTTKEVFSGRYTPELYKKLAVGPDGKPDEAVLASFDNANAMGKEAKALSVRLKNALAEKAEKEGAAYERLSLADKAAGERYDDELANVDRELRYWNTVLTSYENLININLTRGMTPDQVLALVDQLIQQRQQIVQKKQRALSGRPAASKPTSKPTPTPTATEPTQSTGASATADSVAKFKRLRQLHADDPAKMQPFIDAWRRQYGTEPPAD